jgi:hypothetical protein
MKISRRKFLINASALAIGPCILPQLMAVSF